ncbi:MAG: hypothetical protein Q8M16_23510 [Pirellulaceae bacterium]|nr:hypothetical protein [Pirellulaceae bacterium]
MSVALSETSAEQQLTPASERGLRESTSLRWISWKPIQHLLWREWMLLRWWLLATVVLTLTIGTLSVWLALSSDLNKNENPSIVYHQTKAYLTFLAILAPLMFLIGAWVASFVNDRNDPAFAWSTGLPVRWWHTLLVKSFCVLAGSILCLGIAWLLIPLMDATLLRLPRLEAIRTPETEVSRDVQLISAIASFYFYSQFFLCFPLSMICILAVRHQAQGVILTVSVLFVAIIGWQIGFFATQEFRFPERYVPTTHWLFWTVAISVLCAVVAALMYRWRWYSGHFTDWAWRTSLNTAATSSVRSLDRTWATTWSRPSSFKVLAWLSLRRTWLTWLLLPVGLAAFGLGGQANSPAVRVLLPLGVLLMAVFFSSGALWSFTGERAGESETFFAERGISPTKYWLSRFLMVLVGHGILIGVCFSIIGLEIGAGRLYRFPPVYSELVLFLLAAHALSVVSLLAGQTFRNWPMAAFAVFFSVFIYSLVISVQIDNAGLLAVWVSLSLVWFAVPLSWWLTKTNLVFWRANLDWVFPVFVVVVFLAAIVGLPTLRVWVLPSTLPELLQARELPPFRVPKLPGAEPDSNVWLQHSFVTCGQENSPLVLPDETVAMLKASAESFREKLQELNRTIAAEPLTGSTATVQDLENVKTNLVALGKAACVALEIGDGETARMVLEIRTQLLLDLRPIAGLLKLDSVQNTFLRSLADHSSDSALRLLKDLLAQGQPLLGGDSEQSMRQINQSIASQASYLVRKGRSELDPSSAPGSRIAESDRWLSLLFRSRFNTNSRMELTKAMLPQDFYNSWEDERYRREISYDYRFWNANQLPGEISIYRHDDRMWYGDWVSSRVIFGQHYHLNEAMGAAITLRYRLDSLK